MVETVLFSHYRTPIAGNIAIRTDTVSCENQSTTTTSSTISELPLTPPDDTQLTLVHTSDDENWPPPPSPISEACTATTPVSSGGEQTETQGSSSPVVRFTFTVKLDSQLLKRRRQQFDVEQATAAQLAIADVTADDDDETPLASPPESRPSSSKPRPEMAVVIPDVVVCADAVDSKKHGLGGDQQHQSQKDPVHVVPSPTDTVTPQQRCCTASRSCQTEVRDVLASQTQTCTCSCSNNSRTAAVADSLDDVDRGGRLDSDDVDADQLSCRCSSMLDDVTVDDDDDLWAQPEVDRSAVRVDDGSYLRPLVTRVYPADKSDVANRSGALPDGELTHMSWSEVLKEAQTMGIPLHLRTVSASSERQRHPSCSASSTVTSASATPVKRLPDNNVTPHRRATKPASESGGGNKKTPSSSSLSGLKMSFRDLFRLPQLFGRKKSSSSNSGTGSNNRARRSKSMEPQQRIQARNLPMPPNNRLQHRHQRDLPLSAGADDADRTRHWVTRSSRYSASSCPPTSATLTGSTRCRRSRSGGVSLASSSSRHAVDYYPGSSWAASSCSGSLPAYRHHRCAAAAAVTGFDVMDEMVVAIDDVVCASPSMSSFSSSVCSANRTAPWWTHHTTSTTPNSITSGSLTSPGQSASCTLTEIEWVGGGGGNSQFLLFAKTYTTVEAVNILRTLSSNVGQLKTIRSPNFSSWSVIN